MLSYVWPIVLVVLSNVVYQICAKSVPKGMDPLASLTITYLVGAVASGVLYFILNRNGNLIQEYGKLNRFDCQSLNYSLDLVCCFSHF